MLHFIQITSSSRKFLYNAARKTVLTLDLLLNIGSVWNWTALAIFESNILPPSSGLK